MNTVLHNLSGYLAYDPAAPLLFSSGVFWALFLLFLPVYAMLKGRRRQMTVFVVAFSLFFYYKTSGMFVCLLVLTSMVDWLVSRGIASTERRWLRRVLLGASLALSLGVLGYFKYANFFLWNWTQVVEANFQPLDLVLPVGISFYTFQSVSYVVDVYKGRVQPTRTWLDYAFFLTFFPALVAGPIVRAEYFLPQLEKPNHVTVRQMWSALWLIILGLVKKAVIADYIAQYNDLIFANPGGYSGFETLMGVVGYTMQIYCDFSGYSDMAIGLAAIMGFRLAANFDHPYCSRNLSEFWHRWHISLSTWLRDYIYIPLGGNRKGTARTYINNFLTMLIGGLWHGAAWKFVFWGAMHGVGLAIHKACRPLLRRIPDTWPVRAASTALTLLTVSLLWVYFRAETWMDAWVIIRTIFTDFSLAYVVPFVTTRSTWVAMMLVIIGAHALPARVRRKASASFVMSPWWSKALALTAAVQLIVEFRGEDVAPFIYFQF